MSFGISPRLGQSSFMLGRNSLILLYNVLRLSCLIICKVAASKILPDLFPIFSAINLSLQFGCGFYYKPV